MEKCQNSAREASRQDYAGQKHQRLSPGLTVAIDQLVRLAIDPISNSDTRHLSPMRSDLPRFVRRQRPIIPLEDTPELRRHQGFGRPQGQIFWYVRGEGTLVASSWAGRPIIVSDMRPRSRHLNRSAAHRKPPPSPAVSVKLVAAHSINNKNSRPPCKMR